MRDEARRVIRRVEANAPPFDERWHDWRPEPSWQLPQFPAGRERP